MASYCSYDSVIQVLATVFYKILLEHTHAHSFSYYGCFRAVTAKLNGAE